MRIKKRSKIAGDPLGFSTDIEMVKAALLTAQRLYEENPTFENLKKWVHCIYAFKRDMAERMEECLKKLESEMEAALPSVMLEKKRKEYLRGIKREFEEEGSVFKTYNELSKLIFNQTRHREEMDSLEA